MGVTLKWQIPDPTQASYDLTYIYRSTAQDGTYVSLNNQAIADNSYFDIDGTNNLWYKIRFYDSAKAEYSSYSKPIRGGTAHGYCTVDDLRLLTGFASTELTDTELLQFQKFAITLLNGDIGKFYDKEYAEQVSYISPEKENKIDGSNTTFYVRNPILGDKNCDGLVDSDDLYVFTIDTEGVRTVLTVSSIDAKIGKFVVSTAPIGSDTLFVEYMSVPVLEDPADMRIKLATAELVAAMGSQKINPINSTSFRVGKISVSGGGKTQFDLHMDKFRQYVQGIKEKPFIRMPTDPVVLGEYIIPNNPNFRVPVFY